MTGTIFLSEIRSELRDRHVIVYSLIVPIFLYPALFWGLAQWMTYREGSLEKQISRVSWSEKDERALPLFFEAVHGDSHFTRLPAPSPEEALTEDELDAALRVEAGEGGSPEIHVVLDLSRDRSTVAWRRLSEIGTRIRLDLLRERLEPLGETLESVRVLDVREENIASPEEMGRFLLSMVLPMILIIMLSMGAMYPAIDVLVGEKERRTLETLLASGAPRISIVAGKFLTVLAASMSALVINLASMLATIAHQVHFFGEEGGFSVGVPWNAIPTILAAGLLLGAFFSASMILVASFARTFKEGQGYLTPFYMLTILPAIAASIPGVELTTKTAWIPIANVALLLRGALVGKIPTLAAAVVFLSLALYLSVALFLARRVFAREELVIAGAGMRRSPWKGLFSRGGSSAWQS